MSVNKVILLGRIGKEPEVRYMTSGEAVVNVSMATSERWKDKNGEKQEKTEWHNLVFYRKLAEVVGEYVKNGDELYIEGKLQTRKWQTKEGQDRYTTEIVVNEMTMIGGKKGHTDAPASSAPARSEPAKSAPAPAQSKGSFDDFDDNFDSDIPF